MGSRVHAHVVHGGANAMRLFFALLVAGSLGFLAPSQAALAGDAILLDFSSAHCSPCQAMKPTLAQLASNGVAIRHVDVVTEPHLAARYGIRKTPTYVVLSGGQEVARLIGQQSLAALQTALASNRSGPRIPTRATDPSFKNIAAPATRLAPLAGGVSARVRPASVVSEAMPNVSLAQAIEIARAATVRLRVHDGHGYGAGTGTVIDTNGDQALVLTCGHLFRENKGQGKIEVDLYVGGQTQTIIGELLDYDADTHDVALVAIRPGFQMQPVQMIHPQERVRTGQTAFSFGCDRGADPSRRDTMITGVDKYDQHLGVSNLEIAGAPIDGRSGGGLFDEAGRLIGVCNAADYEGDVGIYAGPGSVRWQLDKADLSTIYQRAQAPQVRLASLQQENSSVGVSSTGEADEVNVLNGSNRVSSGEMLNVNGTSMNDREVIVIVRDRKNPTGPAQVMTLNQPSADLMHMIQQHAK
ncbi:MAG: thioredoxin [Rhodopirellula sp.]|nr:thioredoxin [Rhodopirellula sp.]OUX49833.1 MAG: thioredoxin [Rhodopirellula sp. TMED283]